MKLMGILNLASPLGTWGW